MGNSLFPVFYSISVCLILALFLLSLSLSLSLSIYLSISPTPQCPFSVEQSYQSKSFLSLFLVFEWSLIFCNDFKRLTHSFRLKNFLLHLTSFKDKLDQTLDSFHCTSYKSNPTIIWFFSSTLPFTNPTINWVISTKLPSMLTQPDVGVVLFSFVKQEAQPDIGLFLFDFLQWKANQPLNWPNMWTSYNYSSRVIYDSRVVIYNRT